MRKPTNTCPEALETFRNMFRTTNGYRFSPDVAGLQKDYFIRIGPYAGLKEY